MRTKTPPTAPDLLRKSREDWLTECRTVARKLLETRFSITIEDVLKICPRPSYLHRNVTGSVFQHEDFKAMGFTVAKKPSSNGRAIRTLGLR